uniref:Uncharacterized protein n=1 Tax=Anguilla anguilla TaxID=7936 RepID=A0A0E9SE91_ANGAN
MYSRLPVCSWFAAFVYLCLFFSSQNLLTGVNRPNNWVYLLKLYL